jgi:hypothetical protein
MDVACRHEPDVFVPPAVFDRPLTADEDAALRWILWLEWQVLA